MRGGEFLDAARGRMQTKLEFVKDERTVNRYRQLAIKNESSRRQLFQLRDDIGKITSERLARLRLQENLIAITKGNAAKAVPFRLVLPFVAHGNFVDGTGFHRWQWRLHARKKMTNDE